MLVVCEKKINSDLMMLVKENALLIFWRKDFVTYDIVFEMMWRQSKVKDLYERAYSTT